MAFTSIRAIMLPQPGAHATFSIELCQQTDAGGVLININEGALEYLAASARAHSDKRYITGAIGAESLEVARIDFGCSPTADWQFAAKFDLAYYPGKGWFMARLQKSARLPLQAARERSRSPARAPRTTRARSHTRSRSPARAPAQVPARMPAPVSPSRQIRRRSPGDGHP